LLLVVQVAKLQVSVEMITAPIEAEMYIKLLHNKLLTPHQHEVVMQEKMQ